MWCDWSLSRTELTWPMVCVGHQWLTAVETFKPWYFNVVIIGAGYPNCSYSLQLYQWMVVTGKLVLPAGVGMGICEPGLGKTLFQFFSYLLTSLQVLVCNHGSLRWIKCLQREITLCNIHVITGHFLSNKNVLQAWYCLLLQMTFILIPSPAGAFVIAF